MKYFVTVAGQTLDVEVDGGRVLVGGEAVEAHLATVAGTPLHHLLLGGASWTVAAQPLEDVGRWMLGTGGERVEAIVVDERARQAHAPAGGGRGAEPTGGGNVVAPMPGLVVRVEVVAGQRVEAGAGLVVVEAMKMENELRAARAGVVETVHVTVGQAVERGAPLVTITTPESKPQEVTPS
jgi:biotin carboxyl carrier protein